MKNRLACILVGLILAGQMGSSSAAENVLEARDIDGDGLVDAYFDPAQNITWLANPNVSGWRTWSDGVRWVRKFKIGGVGNWRLPQFRDLDAPGCQTAYWKTDCGYNVNPRSSELAHLYFKTLGNVSRFNRQGEYDPDGGLQHRGVFTSLDDVVYYAGKRFPADVNLVWWFGLSDGHQRTSDLGPGGAESFHFWPVHDGDVGQPM